MANRPPGGQGSQAEKPVGDHIKSIIAQINDMPHGIKMESSGANGLYWGMVVRTTVACAIINGKSA